MTIVLTLLLAQRALAAATPFDTIGYTMLATLMGLAVAEHWFLVAPMMARASERSEAGSMTLTPPTVAV